MNVVDSSAWIEYFTGGPNAKFFELPILNQAELVVPTMVLLEVYKHIRRHQGRDEALKAIAGMKQGEIQVLDERLALYAAEIGVEDGLPLADSVILATARLHEATLWTQDSDFEGMGGVRFRRKKN
ncbi:MAG: type II toxin-antitoxin system VapC family toxin [Gemmatimonadota bacterium]